MAIPIVPGIILYLFLTSWLTYSCVLSSEQTIFSKLMDKLPSACYSFTTRLCGEKSAKKLSKITDKTLAIIYFVIVLGSWSIILTYGYDFISKSSHVDSRHKISGYFVFLLCMWSRQKAGTTSPGYITERNMAKYDNYPYDNLLYANKKCPTMGFRKLARSKYDKFTNRHVARYDHFCGWIDNTVGEENYRFFLLFLLIHIFMCLYGTVVCYKLFKGECEDRDLFNAIFFNAETGEEVEADLLVIAHFMFMKHFQLFSVFVLMFAMVVVLGLFFLFHMYMAANGMTTNEYYKWKNVKKWHRKQRQKYEEAVILGKIKTGGSDGGVMAMGEMAEVDVGCVGTSTMPKSSDDGEASQNEGKSNEIRDPGDLPKNIYDLGFAENMKEVLFPRCLRPDAKARALAAHYEFMKQQKGDLDQFTKVENSKTK